MSKFPFVEGVRWGIIGAGDVCEVKSGPALQLAEGSALVAVMRRNAEKAADFARRHGVGKWYDDADALINDPEINAIYVATPPDTHEHYTLKAAAAGKAVYVEKPMARTLQECLNMVSACQKADVPLFVAFYRRALPIYQKVKDLIAAGAIGEVRFVEIKVQKPLQPDIVGASENADNWRILPDVAGGGYFYDLGSHQLDLMDFLLGPIVNAYGFATNQAGLYPAEDVVLGTFHFANGILGQGTWCFNAALSSEIELTTVHGSKGRLSFTFFSNFHIRLEIDGAPTEILSFEMPKHIQQPLIQSVVDELRGKGTCVSTGVSGARTNWVMAQICQRIPAPAYGSID
ncbi:MAG: Gfo/Idh/MocA family oxidoreductase [Spirosomaceae bacterium]|nr:Gfo/Idh/MocA family oxidoreductase [Spirosomataceae bacterium]